MSTKIKKIPHNNPDEQLSPDTLADRRAQIERHRLKFKEILESEGITPEEFLSLIDFMVQYKMKVAKLIVRETYYEFSDLQQDVKTHILSKIDAGHFSKPDLFIEHIKRYVAKIISRYLIDKGIKLKVLIDKEKKLKGEKIPQFIAIAGPGDSSNGKGIQLPSKILDPEGSAIIINNLEYIRDKVQEIFQKIKPGEHKKAIELYIRYKSGDENVPSRKTIAEMLNVDLVRANALIETGRRRLDKALGDDKEMRTILILLKVLKAKNQNSMK